MADDCKIVSITSFSFDPMKCFSRWMIVNQDFLFHLFVNQWLLIMSIISSWNSLTLVIWSCFFSYLSVLNSKVSIYIDFHETWIPIDKKAFWITKILTKKKRNQIRKYSSISTCGRKSWPIDREKKKKEILNINSKPKMYIWMVFFLLCPQWEQTMR